MEEATLQRMYQEFVVDGLTLLPPELLPGVDHDLLYSKADETYAYGRANPADTNHLDLYGDTALVERIPEVTQLLDAPALKQAIEAIVGKDYLLHPHCFLHEALPKDQVFHQDGNLPWNERGHYRSHRPDWALIFYYPQTVTLENGPTEVVPGTQYWTKDFEKRDGNYHPGDAFDRTYFKTTRDSSDAELHARLNTAALDSLGVPDLKRKFVTVPKGSVAICHYDIVHRGTRNAAAQAPRYMYKFYFARTQAPKARSWPKPETGSVRNELKPVVEDIWHWTDNSKLAKPSETVTELQADLLSGAEHLRVAAAYKLAHKVLSDPTQRDRATSVLKEAMTVQTEGIRRAVAYGIRALRKHADCVLDLLNHERPGVRRLAAFALGTEVLGDSDEVVQGLLTSIRSDDDVLTRSNAAYSLGQLARTIGNPDSLASALLDRLKPGVEPNNTEVALLPRSTVRQSLAYALLQCACNHNLNTEIRARIGVHINDDDRYVAGFAEEALNRLEPLSHRSD